MNSIVPAKPFDVDRGMLWGDRLRVLLNSNHISYGEINEVLREKGVFVHSIEKSVIVPLLSSCLLTPSEFESLISRSYTRESLEKYKTDTLTLSKATAEWHDTALMNFSTLVSDLTPDVGHEFVDRPSIVSHSADELEISYKIKKIDMSRDWIGREQVYSASIFATRRNEDLVLELQKTHTCKETDRLNNLIVRSVSNFWKKNSVVENPEPQSIKFTDFSNEERVQFFIKLTGASAKSLSFDELSDIEIVRDETAGPLPDEPAISWMEGKVKRIRINGEKLNELGLLSNNAFHRHCFLVKMSASYNYQEGANTGKCTVIFSFTGKTNHERDFSDSEFNICIERIPRVPDRAVEQAIRRNILRHLWELRDDAMQTITAGRA